MSFRRGRTVKEPTLVLLFEKSSFDIDPGGMVYLSWAGWENLGIGINWNTSPVSFSCHCAVSL